MSDKAPETEEERLARIEAATASWRAGLAALDVIAVTKSFTKRQRRSFSRQYGYGRRPVNNWGDGDLPGPYAEGDVLFRPEDAPANDRLYGMGWGYFVVSAAFSIDEGDAWYMRVTNHPDRGSDRLHVAYADRCSWDHSCDWLAGFTLVETSDPDGLEDRRAKIAAGWAMPGSYNLALDFVEECVRHLAAMPETMPTLAEWTAVRCAALAAVASLDKETS